MLHPIVGPPPPPFHLRDYTAPQFRKPNGVAFLLLWMLFALLFLIFNPVSINQDSHTEWKEPGLEAVDVF